MLSLHAHPVDSLGNLVNVGRLPPRTHLTSTLIDEVVEAVRQFDPEPVSLLVRGSIAAGGFVPGFSDADFIVVSEIERPTELDQVARVLSNRWLPPVQGVDVGWLDEETLAKSSRARLRANLLTCSVALSGTPATDLLRPIRPGADLADALYPDLVGELRTMTLELSRTSGEAGDSSYQIASILRIALRGSHSLVMRLHSVYQAELRRCSLNVCGAFPLLGDVMARLVSWVPSHPQPRQLVEAIEELCERVTDLVQQQADVRHV